MKTFRIIFSLITVLLLFATVIFVSCKKENNSLTKEPAINNLKASNMRFLFKTPIYCGYPPQICGWEIIDCTAPASNCLPTVSITPSQNKSSSREEVAYIDFSEKFSHNNIQEFFKSGDYMALFPEINGLPNVLTELQNGDIILYYQKSNKDGFDYYVGLPKDVNFFSNWDGLEKCVFVVDYNK